MTEPHTESTEDRLIAKYFKPLATDPGAFGLVDDAAAVTPPPGSDLVLKTDAIIGGIHFFTDDPADAVAQKALRVNISDLAAKGAKPLGCLLSLGMPAGIPETWLAAFADGLGVDIARFGCPLFGGDTVKTPDAIMVSVAVIGTVPTGRMVRRAGAKPGDRIFVTGSIGDAALGLRLRKDPTARARWGLTNAENDFLAQRYLIPEPRIALAQALREFASAAMDVSDGLAGDLHKLCRASGVSAEIDTASVPLSAAAQKALGTEAMLIDPILTNGDDYEVLATVSPGNFEGFRAAANLAGVAVSDIGVITTGDDAPRFVQDGRLLNFARRSFSHF
jgi:thiamine-monophosphate kinase